MSRILVVEDSRTQALQIRRMLESEGYHIEEAKNGVEAIQVLKQSPPDIILTDLAMPEMDGLQLVEAIRKDYPSIPVILMTAVGNEEIAVEALKKGAASYIPKRNLLRDLFSSLQAVLSVCQSQRHERRILECLTSAEFRFVLDNDQSLIAPLLWYLEEKIIRIYPCDRNLLIRVGMAVHEALVNAIEHGNLELRSELRQDQDEKAYRDLFNQRRDELPYRDRRVHVTARFSAGESSYTVTDEGPGFDPTGLPDLESPGHLDRIGGRGLRLIRTFMDRVEYNPSGNTITMTKLHLHPLSSGGF